MKKEKTAYFLKGSNKIQKNANKHPHYFPNVKRFSKLYLKGKFKEYFFGIILLLATIACLTSLPLIIAEGVNILSQTSVEWKDNQKTYQQRISLEGNPKLKIDSKKSILVKNIIEFKQKNHIYTITTNSQKKFTGTNLPTEQFLHTKDKIKISWQNISFLSQKLSSQDQKGLLQLSIIIIGISIILFFTRSFSRICIFLPGRKIEAKIREDFFTAVLKIPTSKYNAGDLISRGTNDTSFIRVMLSIGILHTINSSVILLTVFLILLILNWKLCLLAIVPLPIIVILSFKISKKMMRFHKRKQQSLGDLSNFSSQQLHSHDLINTLGIFNELNKRTLRKSKIFILLSKKLIFLRSILTLILSNVSVIASFIILLFGGKFLIGEELNYSELTAFFLYFNILREPLRATSFIIPLIQRGEACLDRIFHIIDVAQDYTNKEKGKAIQSHHKLVKNLNFNKIWIKKINFTYKEKQQKNPFELKVEDLTFDLTKKYGLFGPIGSGKSTFLKILTNNIKGELNEIFILGENYKNINSKILNQLFSCVFQESRHFSGSIKENLESIIQSNENYQHDFFSLKYETAYKISQLKKEIDNFPQKINSYLGEYGINLSGGQKQRLSIFKALIKPQLFLVMDDFISSLDYKTSQKLLYDLFNYWHHGFIISSQRITSLLKCDEILVLNQGKIIAQGTHQNLVNQCTFYRDFFQQQENFSKV